MTSWSWTVWVSLNATLGDPSALNTGIDFGNLVVFRLCFLTKSSFMHDPVHPESIKAFGGACSPFCLASHRKIIHMTLSIHGKRAVFMMGKILSIVGKFALMVGKLC